MFIRLFLLTTLLTGCSWGAWAQSGTHDEQDACRPDVRKFCGDLAKGADETAYLACLESHRNALSPKCLAVLVDHGR